MRLTALACLAAASCAPAFAQQAAPPPVEFTPSFLFAPPDTASPYARNVDFAKPAELFARSELQKAEPVPTLDFSESLRAELRAGRQMDPHDLKFSDAHEEIFKRLNPDGFGPPERRP